MKAVLLAAGVGSRLRPHTDRLPKCMIPIGGVPILGRNLRWLSAEGVTDLAVNLHHRSRAITDYLGSGEAFGASITYSHESELLGTAGAVRNLSDWLDADDFLVVYADNLLRLDLAALGRLHRRVGAVLTMALFHRQDVSASGAVELDEDDRIVRFVEKPRPGETDSHWVNAGVLRCSREVLEAIPTEGPSDFGHDVFPRLLGAGAILAGYKMKVTEELRWIDTPADLARVESEFDDMNQS